MERESGAGNISDAVHRAEGSQTRRLQRGLVGMGAALQCLEGQGVSNETAGGGLGKRRDLPCRGDRAAGGGQTWYTGESKATATRLLRLSCSAVLLESRCLSRSNSRRLRDYQRWDAAAKLEAFATCHFRMTSLSKARAAQRFIAQKRRQEEEASLKDLENSEASLGRSADAS